MVLSPRTDETPGEGCGVEHSEHVGIKLLGISVSLEIDNNEQSSYLPR